MLMSLDMFKSLQHMFFVESFACDTLQKYKASPPNKSWIRTAPFELKCDSPCSSLRLGVLMILDLRDICLNDFHFAWNPLLKF